MRLLRILLYVLCTVALISLILLGYYFHVFDPVIQAGWFLFWITVVAVGITLVGVSVLRHANRKVTQLIPASAGGQPQPAWTKDDWRYDLTREAGIALLTSAVIIMAVEIMMTVYHETDRRRLVSELKASILEVELENAVGPDVAKEVMRQVAGQSIQYSNYNANGSLSLRHDTKGPYILGQVYSEVYVETRGRKADFIIEPKFDDVSEGRRIGLKSIWFGEVDPATKLPRKDVKPKVNLDEKALEDMAVFKDAMKSTYELHKTIPLVIEPGKLYKYELTRTFEEPITGDYKVYTRYACAKMTLQLSYDTTEIAVSGQLLYLHDDYTWGDVKDPQPGAQPGLIKAEITGTVLPMQGIQVVWRKKGHSVQGAMVPISQDSAAVADTSLIGPTRKPASAG